LLGPDEEDDMDMAQPAGGTAICSGAFGESQPPIIATGAASHREAHLTRKTYAGLLSPADGTARSPASGSAPPAGEPWARA
jgi:hypothetical protein